MLIKRKSIEAQANHRAGPGKTTTPKPRVAKFAPVTLSEQDGVRFLHFGTEWIQGAMRIRKPDWIELEYAQQMMLWMLFNRAPQHVVQLGLGAAALTKFCYRRFPQARVTAVDLNPDVIAVCHSMFKLPPDDERLQVLQMDALEFVLDANNLDSIDALQIDLYDATARGPMLESVDFYAACRRCLRADGIATINLFGDHPSFMRNVNALRQVFTQVLFLPEIHQGNRVAVAFNRVRELDFSGLYAVADDIRATTKLPAKFWVHGLKAAD